MTREHILIVGGGPAGLATARSYRQHGGRGEVTLIGDERLLPYRRPPLTKEFLRGELGADELPIQARKWFEEQEIALHLGVRALSINPTEVCVELDGWRLRGDVIVLATGASPARPELPGLDDPRVHTIRVRADSERLVRESGHGTSAIVLGSGFIGCEVAASLAMRGSHVTLIGQEAAPQIERLGAEVAARMATWLGELGVTVKMGQEVVGVHEGAIVQLAERQQVAADNIVLGMGARPRSELAQEAGLAIVEEAILSDAQMRAEERVFAVGDVAFAHNQTAGRALRVEHWGDALSQGEVAGRVLAGEDAHWGEVPGFWSSIGPHTIKYAAWGDGHDESRLEEHSGGAFTAWYRKDGMLVGVLTYERDEDYERGRTMIAEEVVSS